MLLRGHEINAVQLHKFYATAQIYSCILLYEEQHSKKSPDQSSYRPNLLEANGSGRAPYTWCTET